MLTVRAERAPGQADGAEMLVSERPAGTFTRQLFLGDTLDAEDIAGRLLRRGAHPDHPGQEAAKPRNIHVTSSDQKQAVNA